MLNSILSWFGAGYFPKAPGTIGSLAALPFIGVCYIYGGHQAVAVFTGATFCLGYFACKRYLREHSEDLDPSFIVIDEVVGQSIPFLLLSYNWIAIILAFVLFRFFDIWKPWPVSWADGLHGSPAKSALGIMLDDVLAGIYTVITSILLLKLLPYFLD